MNEQETFRGVRNQYSMDTALLMLRVARWLRSRFGVTVLLDRKERAARTFEEAAELAQAEGVGPEWCRRILDRVYSRPVGDAYQEAAGVQICLLAWANAADVNLVDHTEREIARIENVPAEISRAKHEAKTQAGTALPLKIEGT